MPGDVCGALDIQKVPTSAAAEAAVKSLTASNPASKKFNPEAKGPCMKKILASLVIFSAFFVNANADPVQECMVKAKIFQNPSALAGAADVCMQGYFDSLEAEADTCRADAAAKTFVDAEYAACQGSLILGLREQIGICKDEAKSLLKEKDELTTRVSAGAGAGCDKLAQQATEICRDNANKFTGLAQSAATTACKTAGL